MPVSDTDNILIGFGTNSEVYSTNSAGITRKNQFMAGVKTYVQKLIDRTKSFSWNFDNLSSLIYPNLGGTNFSSVAHKLKEWVELSSEAEKLVRIEHIQEQQVFIVISDGDFNNMPGAKASLMDFLSKMNHWFGWNGAVLIWEVGDYKKDTPSMFEDVPNVFHKFGWNISSINSLFTGIHDLDVLDIYTDLHSLYKSNRYQKILEATI